MLEKVIRAQTALVYSPADLLVDFIQRNLRTTCGLQYAQDESVVQNQKELEDVATYRWVRPLNAKAHCVIVKVSPSNVSKMQIGEFVQQLSPDNPMRVLIIAQTYSVFKKLVSQLPQQTISQAFFALRADDVRFLFRTWQVQVPFEVKNALVKEYARDVDKVMDFFSAVRSGVQVSSRRELVDLLGVPSEGIVSFAVSLLQVFVADTERKQQLRMQAIWRVFKVYSAKVGYRKMFGELFLVLSDMMEARLLRVLGSRSLRPEVSSSYDAWRKRWALQFFGKNYTYRSSSAGYYAMLVSRTEGISVSLIAQVRRVLLQGEVSPLVAAWRSEVDALGFLLGVFPSVGDFSLVTARNVPYGEYAGVRLDVL